MFTIQNAMLLNTLLIELEELELAKVNLQKATWYWSTLSKLTIPEARLLNHYYCELGSVKSAINTYSKKRDELLRLKQQSGVSQY